MKIRREIIVVATLLIIVFVALVFILGPKVFSGKLISSDSPAEFVYLNDENNLEVYLENQEIIKDIPDNMVVVLKTYDVENREWIYKKSFIINGDDVDEGDSASYDAIIYIHSGQIENLKTQSLCEMIKTANANQELYIDSPLPETTLAWKFRNLWKYRACLEQ